MAHPAVPQASVVIDALVLLAVVAIVVAVVNVVVIVIVVEGGDTVVTEFVASTQEHALE